MMKKEFRFNSPGRDELFLQLELNGNDIQSVELKAIGCLDFLQQSQKMKKSLKGPVADLKIPEDTDHASLIWKEIILQIQGKWSLPVKEVELCHCRKVDTQTVDLAIIYGAHDADSIRKKTSANTGCGTCLGDVEKMIDNRIKKV